MAGNRVSPKCSPRFLIETSNGVGLTAVSAELTAAAQAMGYRITIVPPPLVEDGNRMITPIIPAPNVDLYYAALAAKTTRVTPYKPLRRIMKEFRKENPDVSADDLMDLMRALNKTAEATDLKLKNSDFLVFEIKRGKGLIAEGTFVERNELVLVLMDLH